MLLEIVPLSSDQSENFEIFQKMTLRSLENGREIIWKIVTENVREFLEMAFWAFEEIFWKFQRKESVENSMENSMKNSLCCNDKYTQWSVKCPTTSRHLNWMQQKMHLKVQLIKQCNCASKTPRDIIQCIW